MPDEEFKLGKLRQNEEPHISPEDKTAGGIASVEKAPVITKEVNPADQAQRELQSQISERNNDAKKRAETMPDTELEQVINSKSAELASINVESEPNPTLRDSKRQLVNSELMAFKENQQKRKEIIDARARVLKHYPDIKKDKADDLAQRAARGEIAI